MFIDPHLNPDKDHYNEFHKILAAIPKRDDPHLIEIHRVCYIGSVPSREFIPVSKW